MTFETYDNLKQFIGKPISNKIWIDLISESFHVSRSCAKEMLHSMYATKELKKL